MYIGDTLYYIYKPIKRKALMNVSADVSRNNSISRLRVIADMIWCSLKYGAMWTEYGDLDFYHRTAENRSTYITTFYNFKLYSKINLKDYRDVFHEKIAFLSKFQNFIKREWISINSSSEEKIKAFLNKHDLVVAKASYGDSGKEVEVLKVSDYRNTAEFLEYIKGKQYNLLEECITNHRDVRRLNESSLNTVRIVTVKKGDSVGILFAGIRVGGAGARIDNISQGGKSARINVMTGIIDSPFYGKASSSHSADGGLTGQDCIGFQLPHWEDVVSTVKKAALIVPEIGIVAWDVAITEDGVDLIEGNESFGSVIMQLYYKSNETGLKPRLISML